MSAAMARIRQPVSQRLVPAIIPLLCLPPMVLGLRTNPGLALPAILLLIAAAAGSIAYSSWAGADLTPHALDVHRVRRCRVPWSEIQNVWVESRFGGHRVIVLTGTGRQIVLPPGRSRDQADLHTIGQYWLSHRGPHWHPPVDES